MKNPPLRVDPQDISEVIDNIPPNRRRRSIVAICFAVVALEGFDAAIIGFIAPQIATHFGAKPAEISAAIAAGMFGLLLGYITAGSVADTRGRKPVLVAGTFAFALATLACAFSASLVQLVAWRFMTGVGVGVAMPAVAALLAELLPARRRASALSGVFCGFLFGSAVAGFLTGQLIDAIGWQGLFLLGGIGPLLLVPAILALLPESPKFLVQIGAASDRIAAALARLGASQAGTALFKTPTPSVEITKGSVAQLFGSQYRSATMLLWLLMFLILGSFYVIASWLPTLIKSSGESVAVASGTATLFQFGGLVGAVVGAFAIRRIAPLKFIGIALLIGAASPLLIASPDATARYAIAVFCSGFLISGPIVVLNAVAVAAYPTQIRSVGAGWASALGRIGSLAGAGSVGLLINSGVGLAEIIAAVSATVLVCAAIVPFLFRKLREPGV
ncbi:MFS transporter [Cupriavidus sp. CuC1]|uniref:MFS transporter n=1 Tax=Cupriavidus sp. CuC1 TaxID=3373131 RepID=UPI0037D51478